jgi:hypothetical protein
MSSGSLFQSVWRYCLPQRNIGARFAQNVPLTWKSFSTHKMALIGDVGQVGARLGPFGDSVNLGSK